MEGVCHICFRVVVHALVTQFILIHFNKFQGLAKGQDFKIKTSAVRRVNSSPDITIRERRTSSSLAPLDVPQSPKSKVQRRNSSGMGTDFGRSSPTMATVQEALAGRNVSAPRHMHCVIRTGMSLCTPSLCNSSLLDPTLMGACHAFTYTWA